MANESKTCKHPAARLYSWVARDDTVSKGNREYDKRLGEGKVLVIVCLECHSILRGEA